MLSLQTGGGGLVLAGGTCGIRQETSTRRYRESTVHGPVKQKKGKKQAAWEDDKKTEARQVKGMKIQRQQQTVCFSETWRWRDTEQMKTPLERI